MWNWREQLGLVGCSVNKSKALKHQLGFKKKSLQTTILKERSLQLKRPAHSLLFFLSLHESYFGIKDFKDTFRLEILRVYNQTLRWVILLNECYILAHVHAFYKMGEALDLLLLYIAFPAAWEWNCVNASKVKKETDTWTEGEGHLSSGKF